MQIVILAGGKGTRMKEKTLRTPKPLLIHKNKTLIEHKLDALPTCITEIIIVIGYLGDLIKQKLGDSYNNTPITYITQEEQKGTAHALWMCKDILKDQFIVVMGDDMYGKEDLETLAAIPNGKWAVLVKAQNVLKSFQKFIVDDNDNLIEMRPDTEGAIPYNYLYTGACLLTPHIFTKEMVAISDTEFGLPHTFVSFVPDQIIKVIQANTWKQITCPEDLE